MTDNALKIIKDELARIDEARAKATHGSWQGIDFLSDNETNGKLSIHIGGGPLELSPQHFGIFHTSDLSESDQKFIALAANKITNLTKALSVAVEILNGVSLFKDANRNIYDCAESMSVDAEFGLKDIANILSGGKDGK